jgi:hypothetical protein
LAVAGLIVALGVLAPGARGVPPLHTAFPRITTSPAHADWEAKARYWHARYAKAHRLLVEREKRLYDQRRALMHRPDVVESIRLASVVYGVSTTWMLSRGSCESTGGHGFNPRAVNSKSKASGTFQFLWSTWRSTPFASFSPFSPYANALAAGWMMGPAARAGEWDCR